MKWGLLLLIVSAISEALWNIALKKSQGLYDWQVNATGVIVLIIGIITFKKAIGINAFKYRYCNLERRFANAYHLVRCISF